MAAIKNRYHKMECIVTAVLGMTAALFAVYLFSAGSGILWLKTLCAIIAIASSLLSMGFLYLTGELFKQRSLWMGVSFASFILCIFISLLCNYPSPEDILLS